MSLLEWLGVVHTEIRIIAGIQASEFAQILKTRPASQAAFVERKDKSELPHPSQACSKGGPGRLFGCRSAPKPARRNQGRISQRGPPIALAWVWSYPISHRLSPLLMMLSLGSFRPVALVIGGVSHVCERYSRRLIGIATAESRVIDCAKRD